MSKENTNLSIVEGIYDIQPIYPPPLSLLEISIYVSFIILFVSTIIYLTWKYFYSNKAIAKRNIITLKKNYLRQNISSHIAIYQLCKIIMLGLHLNSLGENTLISKKLLHKQKKWLIFTRELSLLRYSKNEIKTDKLNAIFEQSLYWLKIWS